MIGIVTICVCILLLTLMHLLLFYTIKVCQDSNGRFMSEKLNIRAKLTLNSSVTPVKVLDTRHWIVQLVRLEKGPLTAMQLHE